MGSKDKQLVLRVLRSRSVRTLNRDFEVVDIEVDERILRGIFNSNQHNLDPGNVFTIRWDCRNQVSPFKLRLENKDEISLIAKLIENGYTLLNKLITSFYKQFKTKIVFVHVRPLLIGVSHDSEDDLICFKEHLSSGVVTTTLLDLLKEPTGIEIPSNDDDIPVAESSRQGLATCNVHKDSEHTQTSQSNQSHEATSTESEYHVRASEHSPGKGNSEDLPHSKETQSLEVVCKLEPSDACDVTGKSSPEQFETTKARVLGLDPPVPSVSGQTVLLSVLPGSRPENSFEDWGHLGQTYIDDGNSQTRKGIRQQETSQQETHSRPPQEKQNDENTFCQKETAYLQDSATEPPNTEQHTIPETPQDQPRNQDQHAALKQLNVPETTHIPSAADDDSVSDLETISDQEHPDLETPFDPDAFYASVLTADQQSTVGHQISQTTHRPRVTDCPPRPRCKGVDTVFILNTTERLGQQGAKEMKHIATSIVTKIETFAMKDSELEENFAVVVFGDEASVLSQPTNDYGSIVDTIEDLSCGGEKSLLDALVVCGVSLDGIGTLSISRAHKVPSRYIIITDGRDGHDMSSKQELIPYLRENDYINQSNFVWIPVGNADLTYLDALSKLSGGKLVDGKNEKELSQLCRYQRTQITIGRIYCYVNKHPPTEDTLEQYISTLSCAFSSDANEEEEAEIIDTVKKKIDREDGCGNIDETVNEQTETIEIESLLPLGTRVGRGPDWHSQDIDSEGLGTVVNHCTNPTGRLWVKWDTDQLCVYRYGHENAYDVWQVEDKPRNLLTNDALEGCEVIRGPDWQCNKFAEEDGGPGCVGVIIRRGDAGQIKVRWRETLFIGTYRYHTVGVKDVVLLDVNGLPGEHNRDEQMEVTPINASALSSEPKRGTLVWHWKDHDNNWHQYNSDVNDKLEKEYMSSRSSCLIERGGRRYRVTFNKNVESDLTDGSKREVSRKYVDD